MTGQSPADLASRLQEAICGGDANLAKQLVGQLCRQGGAIRVFPQSSDNLLAKVYFRDRDNCLNKPRLFQFSTASTLAELKMRVTAELDIPRQVQCCVAGGRIPPDETPLAQLDTGHEVTVHLYLLSKGQFRHRWDLDRQVDVAVAPLPPAAVAVAAVAGGANLQAPPPALRPPQPPPQALVGTEVQQPGWDCAACTYRNNPARPGCEICGAERPAGYLRPPGAAAIGADAVEEEIYEIVD